MKKLFANLFVAVLVGGWLGLHAQETVTITPEEAAQSLRSLFGLSGNEDVTFEPEIAEEDTDDDLSATSSEVVVSDAEDEENLSATSPEVVVSDAEDEEDTPVNFMAGNSSADEDDDDEFDDSELIQVIQAQADEAASAIGAKADEVLSAIDAKTDEATTTIENKTGETTSAIDAKADEATSAIGAKADEAVTAIDTKAGEAISAIDAKTDEAASAIGALSQEASDALSQQAEQIQKNLDQRYQDATEAEQSAAEAEQRASERIDELDGLLNGRKRIAMNLFACAQPTFTTGNENTIAESVAYDLLSDFNQFFLQSPRFRVLSRQDDAVVNSELTRIINNATVGGNMEELSKIGMELGLDYVVTGAVKQLFIAPPQVTTIQLTGAKYISIARAIIELDYRIVNIATKEIIWADHIFIDLTPAEIQESGNDVVTLYHVLTQLASRRIAEAMDAIEPIRVVRVMPNGQFILDRAGNLIIPGSFFDLYRQGEPIVNSATGEELGRPEELLATIQIKRVDTKLSYGEIVIGSGVITPSDLESGIVARPHRDPVYLTPDPASSAPPVIKLPFDR